MEFKSNEVRFAEVKLVFGLFSCMVLVTDDHIGVH